MSRPFTTGIAFFSVAPHGRSAWNFPDWMFCRKSCASSAAGGSSSFSEGSESELFEPDSESTPVGSSFAMFSGSAGGADPAGWPGERFAHSSESSRPSLLEECVKGHTNSGDRAAHQGRVTGGILFAP